MNTLRRWMRVILSLMVFFFLSCTNKENFHEDTVNVVVLFPDYCKSLCSKINENFDVINNLTRALRNGDSIVSITSRTGLWYVNFWSGNIMSFGVWGGKSLPFIGLSLDESGVPYWVIVDNCSQDDISRIVGRDAFIDKGQIEEFYLSFGEKVPVNGNIRMVFDETSTTFLLYEGYKLLHKYDIARTRDYLEYSGGSASNIRSVVEKDDCVEFELLDGKTFTISKLALSIKLDASKLVFKKGGDVHTINYLLSGVKDKATLDVEASNGWQVSITPETSVSGTITVTAPENIEETIITVTAREAIWTAKWELRCGKPKFSLSKSECHAGYNGGNVSVTVETNLNFSVKIPDDAQSWVELVAEETADEKIVLRVSKNEEAYARNATILCLGEDGIVLDKFNVSQSWDENKIFEVQNPEGGGLQEYIKTRNMSNVKKLKISGSLNDSDFLFLRSMSSLKYLDIYDVEAYSLPEGCFRNIEYWRCEKIILPKTLTAISEKCFYGCKSIKEILIPVSCETIGVSAFEYCSSLSSISFETGSCLKTMSYSSFKSCSSLTSVSIPASCETIDAYAFRGCALTDVTCANGSALTTIGSEAFAACDDLHRIDMQNCTKLKSVASRAFYGDNQIYSFQIGAVVPPSCPTDAFGNVGEYSVLKVPSGSEDAYKAASGWGEFYKIIVNE